MKSTTMSRTGALAVAAVAGLALYGCSKASETDSKSSGPAAEAAPASPATAGQRTAALPEARPAAPDPTTAAVAAAVAADRASGAILTNAAAGAKPSPAPGSALAAVAAGGDEPIPAGTAVAASDDTYDVVVDTPDGVASGASGTVRVKVIPKNGWKMNHDFPTQLEVTAPAGVAVTKAKQGIADAEKFEDKKAIFAVGFKPSTAGKKKFEAKLKFAVCTEDSCVPKRAALAWNINVK